ncbi:hypothetical protein L289_0453 [Acinetobacter gerneri DSM 14967 = CIP 107464 = MTCC 9824]|nr:hypothetical protein L289_0453 [Acinetobacter gerneri DSM 14967 = CIP 107464 = MTCC 9824]
MPSLLVADTTPLAKLVIPFGASAKSKPFAFKLGPFAIEMPSAETVVEPSALLTTNPVLFNTELLPAPSVVVTLFNVMSGLSLIWAWLAVTAVVILVSPTIAKVEPSLLLDVPEAASLKYNGVVTAVFKLFNAAATPVTLLATPFGLLTTLYVGAVSAPVAAL